MAAPSRPSAAIQIIRPPPSSDPTALPPNATPQPPPVATDKDKRKDTTQRLCRNVLIYGSCRFQDSGCVYYHPPPGADLTDTASPSLTVPGVAPIQDPNHPQDLNSTNDASLNAGVNAIAKGFSEIGAGHLSAPVFIPKTPMPDGSSPQVDTPSLALPAEPQEEWPSMPPGGLINSSEMGPQPVEHGYDTSSYVGGQQLEGGMYMPHHPMRQPLDYHLYTSPLPHVSNPSLSSHPLHSFFIPDDLRNFLTARHEAVYATPPPHTGLPAELGVYHTLYQLGAPPTGGSRVYGHPAPLYRATSSVDGNVYALKRIEGFKLVNEAAFGVIDTWRRMKHPNIVGMREAFTTKAFNDNSLILVYDFHPNSTTLWDEHLNPTPEPPPPAPTAQSKPRQGMPIAERQLWSYITQIANALKAVHSSGLAARNLDPSKVLITGKHRMRLNGCGILDVLAFDASTPVSVFQQEDLVSFGKLVISMACEFFQPGQHPAAPLDHISRHYSPDVKNIVLFLISKPGPSKSIDDAMRMIGSRILNEFDAMQNYADELESEMGAELENGRIMRLLSKLGFINERAEFELDPRWSDTGDRYILKLFRDYVFHSIGVDGTPILDLSHVLTCLNKLDAGLDERVMLVSRDDQSCLVVSYREIKTCVEAAYNELRTAGTQRMGMR